MGFWNWQGQVWRRAWRDTWCAVIQHSWKTVFRDGIFLLLAVVILLGSQRYLVSQGVMSEDNTKDTFVWIVLTVIAAVGAFALWFFVEGLILVPYKMWKNANAAAIPAAPMSAQGVFPDWKISELLKYLRPDLPLKPEKAWMPALNAVEDRLSTGQLEVWGRRHLPAGSQERPSLEKIDPTYWKDADLLGWAADTEHPSSVHTRRRSLKTEWEYRDLQLNKAQALSLWPQPLAKPRPIERDKKLEEAIGYLMFQEWGRDVYKDTGDQVPLLGAALRWFHQLAVDGEVKVWARREPNHGVYELIPADFWKTNHVDMLDLLGEPPPKTTKTGSELQFGSRYDPMVSAVETEKALLSINRRGGIYSVGA